MIAGQRRNRLASCCGPCIAIASVALVAFAADENDQPTRQQVRGRKEARTMAGAISLAQIVDGRQVDAEMVDQPVLRYGDTPRNNEQGSAWIWHVKGRPAAILELYKNVGDQQPWVFVVSSLTTDLIQADVGLPQSWDVAQGGIVWRTFADAPAPAERSAARLRQMKELSARFSAHEFWDPDNQRYELRLLVQPIYKYADREAGILDGAVFVLTHGTNPEVVMLLEAIQEGSAAKYRYGLARLGHAGLHVHFDGREVWTQQRVNGTSPREPYWLFFKPPLSVQNDE